MSRAIHGFPVLVILIVLAVGSMAASVQSQKNLDNRYQVNSGKDSMSMVAMAKAFLREQQSRTTSEVLTLNITNLIILIVVKAIIFGFGFLGGGFGGGHQRSSSSATPIESLFGKADLMMMMSFALASTSEDYNCLYRTACEEPETASQYTTASKMLLKGAKLFKK